jgi:hypothetical protein
MTKSKHTKLPWKTFLKGSQIGDSNNEETVLIYDYYDCDTYGEATNYQQIKEKQLESLPDELKEYYAGATPQDHGFDDCGVWVKEIIYYIAFHTGMPEDLKQKYNITFIEIP